MYEVSDKVGNSFFTKNYKLALEIVKDNSNPFVNIRKLNDKLKVAKEHLVKDMADFCVYFY